MESIFDNLEIPFVRDLYPHNQKTFDSMVDAIASRTRVSISVPSETGFKFAAIEMLKTLPHTKFVYLSQSSFSSGQVESQGIKNDVELENVTFMTYEELAALSTADAKALAKDTDVVVMTDYLSVAAAYEAKLEKFLSYLVKDAPILGLTNLRPFQIEADDQLTKKFNALLGEGTTKEEYFDLRQACKYGNFEYPQYIYSDLSQASRITKFCAEVKAAGDDERYGKFSTRAKYYPAAKAEQLAWLSDQLPSHSEGKYIVLCAQRGAFDKEREILSSIIPTLSLCKEFFYDGTGAKEREVDKFILANGKETMCFLYATADSLLDIKMDDVTGCFFLYKMTKPWQLYQAINVALATSHIKYKYPLIVDPYNNTMTIRYITPMTDFGTDFTLMNCLYFELGTTAEEKALYRKDETVPLLYVLNAFPDTEAFNRVTNSFIAQRVKDNDLRYLNDLLDKTEAAGITISKKNPFAINGVDFIKWGNHLKRIDFNRYLPKDLTQKELTAIRKRVEALDIFGELT